MFFCHFNGLPSCIKSYLFSASKAKKIVLTSNNSMCGEYHVAPTIPLCFGLVAPTIILNVSFKIISSVDNGHHKVRLLDLEYHSVFLPRKNWVRPTPSPANECGPRIIKNVRKYSFVNIGSTY